MTDQLRECPFCKEKSLQMDQMEVDVGVGTLQGPEMWHCNSCQSYWNGPYLFTNTRPTSEREARLVEALKVCEQDRVLLYGGGQTLKDAISYQVDDALAAYSPEIPDSSGQAKPSTDGKL